MTVWKYRYYMLALAGQALVWSNREFVQPGWQDLLFGVGLFMSFAGVILQIVEAPNFKNKNSKSGAV